jgi:hypothetical protein
MSYSPRTVLKNGAAQALGASQTAKPVSEEFIVTAEGSHSCLIGLKVSGYNGTVTAKLQHSLLGGDLANWRDDGTVSITAAGWFYIDHFAYAVNNGNTIKYPIGCLGRVVVTTAAGAAVTVERCIVLQAEG